MTAHYKVEGTWVQPEEIYVKNNNIWKPVRKVQVKDSGSWTEGYFWDETPVSNPLLFVEQIRGGSGSNTWRYLGVRARSSNSQPEPDLKLIRVLIRHDERPANQYSQGYVSANHPDWPNEDWSHFRFGGSGEPQSNFSKFKTYPVKASKNTFIKGGWWHVSAWTQDRRNNWGPGVHRKIWIPMRASNPGNAGQMFLVARFTPNQPDGIISNDDLGYVDEINVGVGELSPNGGKTFIQIFYGQDIPNRLSRMTYFDEVTKAQVLLQRSSDDHGPAGEANVHIFSHSHPIRGTVLGSTGTNHGLVGTLLRGQSKWFTLPQSALNALKSPQTKGLGLYSPGGVSNRPLENQLKLTGLQTYPRQGELYLEWQEQR